MTHSPLILIADDDEDIRLALSVLLRGAGYKVIEAKSIKDVAIQAQRLCPELILLDMNFHSDTTSGQDGLNILPTLNKDNTQVILMTAWATIDLAVKGIQLGAVDFIEKPWSNQNLLNTICRHIKSKAFKQNSETGSKNSDHEEWVFKSDSMAQIEQLTQRVARTDANILITGENGVGKSQLARRIHCLSNRADQPFVPVNMSAVPDSLFESELYGHKKGAFTDAKADRKGQFEIANLGTLFLDEIGTLPIRLQPKLLQSLESKTFSSVGDSHQKFADVRIITATNADLNELIENKLFRQDLYFRINTIIIDIPPLRSRPTDIEPLANKLKDKHTRTYALKEIKFTPCAMNSLQSYPWPGNIRELSNVIERCVLMCTDGMLDSQLVTDALHSSGPSALKGFNSLPASSQGAQSTSPIEPLEKMEEDMINRAMLEAQGNQSLAASLLGISRHALSRRLDKFGISFGS